MDKRAELNLFLIRVDELIESKYIIADVKIVNVLKSIATSETLLAIFSNCVEGFDYDIAFDTYLKKDKGSEAGKGEFVMPNSTKDFLALTFNVLMDIDANRMTLGEFINTYFYVDGSFSYAYESFINNMIKPFKSAVKTLTESVIEGKVQDPIKALTELEQKKAEEKAKQEKLQKQNSDEVSKAYNSALKEIREILFVNKEKIKKSNLKDDKKKDILLIIDTFGDAVGSEDKDAINYAFTAYKFMVKANKFKLKGKVKKISVLIKGIYNAI